MKIQLIRHATLLLTINNKTLLVDPMFSDAGTLTPIPGVPNQQHNPLVDLPLPISQLLTPDGILVTHTHHDHFDEAAARLLPKHVPIICQPEDEQKLKEYGFSAVKPVTETISWMGIDIHRTGGSHGTGEIAMKMAPVSGYVLKAPGEPSLYIAGDTVWCNDVHAALTDHKPDLVVVNGGCAEFSEGGPITMDTPDIHRVCCSDPFMSVIVVHMEAWNHCSLSRKTLRSKLSLNDLPNPLYIPEDGEEIHFHIGK